MRAHQLLDPTRPGDKAQRLQAELRNRVVGQDEAVEQVVGLYQMHLAGLNAPGRPVGTLLFLGPTGSGKTRLVEATAEALVGDAQAVLKIDCGELQHSHELAKLVGSPPGYLGHRESQPLLSQDALNRHHTEAVKLSFVLFDEIEKASDALWNLLLGILDKATLTLGDNRRVDFSQAIIFMTSNLGATEMESILRPGLGFRVSQSGTDGRVGSANAAADKLHRAGLMAARRRFSPEFVNRIDAMVVFRPLGEAELGRILDLELARLQTRICLSAQRGGFALSLSDDAKAFLLKRGTDVRYGARPLKRAIDRALVSPLSNLIATGQVCKGDLVRVDLSSRREALLFSKEADGRPPCAFAKQVGALAHTVAMAGKVAA